MEKLEKVSGVCCEDITDFLDARRAHYLILPEYEPLTDPTKELVPIPHNYQIMTSRDIEDDLLGEYGVPGAYENLDGGKNSMAIYHSSLFPPDNSRRTDEFTTIFFVDMDMFNHLSQSPEKAMADYIAKHQYK